MQYQAQYSVRDSFNLKMDEEDALKPPKLFQRIPSAVPYEIPINQYGIAIAIALFLVLAIYKTSPLGLISAQGILWFVLLRITVAGLKSPGQLAQSKYGHHLESNNRSKSL